MAGFRGSRWAREAFLAVAEFARIQIVLCGRHHEMLNVPTEMPVDGPPADEQPGCCAAAGLQKERVVVRQAGDRYFAAASRLLTSFQLTTL
jgi:hypothetical protein